MKRAHYQVARAREGISNKALQVPQVKTLSDKLSLSMKSSLRATLRLRFALEALFNMGQEQRELGDYDAMRAAFEKLSKRADPLTL